MSKVSIVKCNSYKDYNNLKKTIKKSIDLIGGFKKYIKPNDRVLLKPNLCDPVKREQRATTDPMVVKAVIELVKEITPKVYIADLPAIDKPNITKETLVKTGLMKVLKETKTKPLDLQKAGFIPKIIPDYQILDRTDFSKVYFYSDVIINLPKLKSHGITHITAAVKNLFGLVHMGERKYLHSEFNDEDFSKGLVDIYSFMKDKVKLNILDAIIGMEGDEGPSYGEPVRLGYIVASNDAISLDAIGAKITGHNPYAIHTIKNGHIRKINNANIENIELVGDELKERNFNQHSNYENRNKSLKDKKLMPKIIQEKCKKCGACYNECPVNAIKKYDEETYEIKEKECIKCYCCIEACIYKSIKLKQNKDEKEDKETFKFSNLRLGNNCNQECLFCTVSNEHEKEMELKEVKKLIKQLVKQGTKRIDFTGGEPTIKKELPKIFKYAKESGILRVALQTNGINLHNKTFLKELVDNGLEFITLSFHSHKKETYNKITGKKHYNKSIKALENISNSNINYSVSYVINKLNYKDINDFIDFIENYNPVSLYFSFLRPNGRTKENKWIVPKLKEVEKYVISAMDYTEKKGIDYEFEGLPLCYMGKHYKKSSEYTREFEKPTQGYVSSNESKLDLHGDIHSNLKVKGKQCKECKLNKKCVGVWKEYAEIYGTKELKPIK